MTIKLFLEICMEWLFWIGVHAAALFAIVSIIALAIDEIYFNKKSKTKKIRQRQQLS